MKPEDIIKATRNSLNIYSFTAEALERLIAAIQSEHKCQTCETLARTVMMDQTAHDTHTAAKREWVGLTQEDIDIAFDDTQEGGGFNEFARAIEQTLRRKNS